MAPMTVEPMPSESPAAGPTVSGTITLQEGTSLPEGGKVLIEIQDVSLADAPATIIGEAEIAITDATVTELPFEVSYDAAEIVETNTYGLSVRVEDVDGQLMLTNDTATPVITAGAPTTDVSIEVVAVQ